MWQPDLPGLSLAEGKTNFALWCVTSAPLLRKDLATPAYPLHHFLMRAVILPLWCDHLALGSMINGKWPATPVLGAVPRSCWLGSLPPEHRLICSSTPQPRIDMPSALPHYKFSWPIQRAPSRDITLQIHI